jgi:hypothetical protein
MKAAIVLLASLAASACNWFEDPAPNKARLVVQGEAGKMVRLIVSTRFAAAVNEQRQTRVEIFDSDTIVTTLPFERVYTIEDDQRFFVETSRLDTDLQNVHMQVFIDDRRQFNEVGALLAEAPYRFVYAFNQVITRDIILL